MNSATTEAGQRKKSYRRLRIVTVTAIYRLGIFFAVFLALDFFYSRMFHHPAEIARVIDPAFHHTFRPNFDGYELWGERQYRLFTNNLGFKDAAARNVSLKPDTRRVVLIGDSFTEGLGTPFEASFAGMLAVAGQRRAEKTEFLNAAVESYSPTLYYRRIKFLLDSGYVFDEVVVFPDLSNVNDEATSYFCFDDVPQYKALCRDQTSQLETGGGECSDNRDGALWDYLERNFAIHDRLRSIGRSLQQNFAVSDSLRMLVKFKLQVWSGELKRGQLTPSWRIGWSVPNYDVGDTYAPLGVDGGIDRTLVHMGALADLLAQRHIALTIAVYPWPLSLVQNDPGGSWVAIWRKFCVTKCKAFIDTFPDFIAARDAHPADWYERYFVSGDAHFSAAGHRIVFDALTKAGL
jgi:hypothetical protein